MWEALYEGYRAEIGYAASWTLRTEGLVRQRIDKWAAEAQSLELERQNVDRVYGKLKLVEFALGEARGGVSGELETGNHWTQSLDSDLLTAALIALEETSPDLPTAGGRMDTVAGLARSVADDLSITMHRLRLADDELWWCQTRKGVLWWLQKQATLRGYVPAWEELDTSERPQLPLRLPPPLKPSEVVYDRGGSGVHYPFAKRIARFVMYLVQTRGGRRSTLERSDLERVPKRFWSEAGSWHVKVHGHLIRSNNDWNGSPPTRQRMRKYLNELSQEFFKTGG